MSEGRFLSLWTKYLPVIRILLKKSVSEEQQVSLGKMELKSLDNRKNASYTFHLVITKGKLENKIGSAVIGKDLFTLLTDDTMIRKFMHDKIVNIRMGNSFLMTIKSDPAEVPTDNISLTEDIEQTP